MNTAEITMDKIVSLAKRRGFVFPGSDIYGGLANSWDYGPYGAQLKKNIKDHWWRTFVESRNDMVGLDAAIIMNPKVWEASGHISGFNDFLVECKECHERLRPDQHLDAANQNAFMLAFSEMTFKKMEIEKLKKEASPDQAMIEKYEHDVETLAEKIFGALRTIECPHCGKRDWSHPTLFNLMFKTFIGPAEESANIAYLRPETAQAMFVDFPLVAGVSRKRLPFGIAQIGKAFRNEITPGNFIFRTREFEQMEIEYFFDSKKREWNEVFTYWQSEMESWMKSVGMDMARIHPTEIAENERAHYSARTVDFEFDYPFGRKELFGLACRTDYDLSRHAKFSGQDMTWQDPETKEKITPFVVEPTFGLDRGLLAILLSAYDEEPVGEGETRTVLRLAKSIAPVKVAVFPLMKNKPELVDKARKVFEVLRKDIVCEFDDNGNVGKRYRRQDEIGTPYCVTIDFQTLDDGTVTVRDRDTMKQDRLSLADLGNYLWEHLR
ncbi:MAG: glycine--tRNA ligase [Candidatus Moraniibacteriota bacterium]|nr:MAG: glycine--tRNA ligase [Candidatus Moranbacteria bacterium]